MPENEATHRASAPKPKLCFGNKRKSRNVAGSVASRLFLFLVTSLLGLAPALKSVAQTVVAYSSPGPAYEDRSYTVRAGGKPVPVFKSRVGPFAYFSFQGNIQVEVEISEAVTSAKVRPTNNAVNPVISGKKISFSLANRANVTVEINGRVERPLFLFANPLEINVPQPTDANVLYYGPGIHRVGSVDASNKTVYVAGGAVVHGRFGGTDFKMLGRGVLDTMAVPDGPKIILWNAKNVSLEGIIVNNAQRWTVFAKDADNINIENMKILNWEVVNDGFDLAGCHGVTINNCFVRTNDDGVTTKAADYMPTNRTTRNIVVQNTVFWTDTYGNSMVVGQESQTDSMTHVIFRNNDVLRAGTGAAMAVINDHRAYFKDILFENIRVEGAQDRLFKFTIAADDGPGNPGVIDGVTFRNISVDQPKIPLSTMAGFSEIGLIKNVTFENVRYNGNLVMNPAQAKLMMYQFAKNVVFKGDGQTSSGYCSRPGFLATASHRSIDASGAVDGDINTRWTADTPQRPGQWYVVNTREPITFNKVVINSGVSIYDYPRVYKIYTSNDLDAWGAPIAEGTGTSAIVEVPVPLQTKQYIKIEQSGTNQWSSFSIHELQLYNNSALANIPIAPVNCQTGLQLAAAAENQSWKEDSNQLFPNPAANRTTLHYLAKQSGRIEVVVSNVLGRKEIASKIYAVREGANDIALDLGGAASGLYVVTVTGFGASSQLKLLLHK